MIARRFGDLDFPESVMAYLRERGHDDLALGRYADRVHQDLAGMLPWLGDARSAWDIGCGLAALTALLCRDHGLQRYRLTDGDGSAPRKVGYCPRTQGWFDTRVSEQFVRANGGDRAVPVGRWDGDCDLVVSLKSWGHHYPVATYLDQARRAMRPGGRLVLDIRAGTDGAAEIARAGFRLLGQIAEKPKRRRLVFECDA